MPVTETKPETAPPLPAGEVVVTVRGLTKVFKDFWGRPKARAVDNVEFEVRRGEVFGLLGPNGSGKSTTVKLLLGLLHPTRGYIEVFGRPPRNVATKERIGYLPEESYLYRYLDSAETLDFFGNLFHLPPGERAKRAQQLLEMVGLNQVRRRTVGEFSKGMQRRIGLAQALINDPDLVILDEPTSGLDPIGCREVKDLILALARRGKTVILSSHLLADVEDVCDRVTILYGGKVRAAGTVNELLTATDAVTIEADALDDETLAEVRRVIESKAGRSVRSVSAPRKKLETLFLDIVEQAQAEGVATAGAQAGGEVAEFLGGPAQQQPTEGRAVIDALVAQDEAAKKRPGAAAEAQQPAPSGPDRGVLDELAKPAAAKEEPKPAGEVLPKDSVDRDVIDGLLDKKDGAP